MDAGNPYSAPRNEPPAPALQQDEGGIRVVADLTHADQVAMVKLLGKRRQNHLLGAMLGLPIGLAIGMLIDENSRGPGLYGFIGGYGLAYALIILIGRMIIHRNRQAMRRSPFLGTCVYQFSPAGMTLTGEQHSCRVDWPVVDRLLVTPLGLCLVPYELAAWWVPRKAFATPADLDALIAYIRQVRPELPIENDAVKVPAAKSAWS